MIRIVPFILLVLVFGCRPSEEGTTDSISIATIQKHIEVLASDEFGGRKPFTEFEKKTVGYLANSLENIGVAPGNQGSYFQDVPMVEINGQPNEQMEFSGPRPMTLKYGEEFVTFSEHETNDIEVKASEVVFCGFGIVAPEYNWNDFEGVDVKGKTIVVLVNDPGFGGEDETHFKGNTMTYYGRWTYKYEEAARQGAAAVLIIHETTSAGYPWFVVQNSWAGKRLGLKTADGGKSKSPVQGWITLDVANTMFDQAGLDLSEQIRLARTNDFQAKELPYQMSHSIHNDMQYNNSQNVIGVIEGSERPEEYIIYTAHWDHLGIAGVVDNDSIYNGAIDNASGCSAVLSIAEAFQGKPQERSLIFLFVTAEEQGLLGSEYYATNPIYPIDQTVANLNMDGMQSIGPTDYLTIVGIGQSDMDDYASEVAAEQGREILPDPNAEKGYFFRSDHFNFAKVGIPALYAEGGKSHREKGEEYFKQQEDGYVADRYHRPGDEFDPETWDLRGIQEDAYLYYLVGRRLANETSWPQWKTGSEFSR